MKRTLRFFVVFALIKFLYSYVVFKRMLLLFVFIVIFIVNRIPEIFIHVRFIYTFLKMSKIINLLNIGS